MHSWHIQAHSGVTLPDGISLTNDLRSYGGYLVASGLFFTIGVFHGGFLKPALGAATLAYAGFGFARLLALWVDGVPVQSSVIAMAVELVVAVLCLVALLGRHPNA